MLELQVANTDVSSGNIAVTWCVDTDTIQRLGRLKIQDPQVVICVAPTQNYHIRREYRKVVPLKDLMTYLEVRASGENKIWAFIAEKSRKDTRNRYLTREDSDFTTAVLSPDGTEWSALFNGRYVQEGDQTAYRYFPTNPATPIAINVPTVAFAAEPPKWEKVWVNYWFRSKPQDQCDYRRRRLLAYTVQPLVILLDVLLLRTFILLVSTLWWSRGMSLKFHLHPLRYSGIDAIEMWQGGSWCMPHLPEDNGSTDISLSYCVRKMWKLVFTPPALAGLWLAFHFHVLLSLVLIVLAAASIVTLAFTISSGMVNRWLAAIGNWWTVQQAVPTPWYLEEEEMQAITCNQSFKKRTSINALPTKYRSINLRFQDLKAKVCRPFSA